jgi:carnitine O-palmitoyltransferase 2
MQKNNPAGKEEMMAAVTEATNKHFELTRNAAMGQGFDRHLFALRTLAEEAGKDLEIFDDASYQHLNHIVLSTSTLSADSVLIGGFAPVTSDGYGIGYNVSTDAIRCNVLTYPSRDSAQFVSCLQETLDDLHCLMAGKNFK